MYYTAITASIKRSTEVIFFFQQVIYREVISMQMCFMNIKGERVLIDSHKEGLLCCKGVCLEAKHLFHICFIHNLHC